MSKMIRPHNPRANLTLIRSSVGRDRVRVRRSVWSLFRVFGALAQLFIAPVRWVLGPDNGSRPMRTTRHNTLQLSSLEKGRGPSIRISGRRPLGSSES